MFTVVLGPVGRCNVTLRFTQEKQIMLDHFYQTGLNPLTLPQYSEKWSNIFCFSRRLVGMLRYSIGRSAVGW